MVDGVLRTARRNLAVKETAMMNTSRTKIARLGPNGEEVVFDRPTITTWKLGEPGRYPPKKAETTAKKENAS